MSEQVAEKWLTPEDVATRLQVCTKTVYALLKAGKLAGQRVGRQWRIPAQAVSSAPKD